MNLLHAVIEIRFTIIIIFLLSTPSSLFVVGRIFGGTSSSSLIRRGAHSFRPASAAATNAIFTSISSSHQQGGGGQGSGSNRRTTSRSLSYNDDNNNMPGSLFTEQTLICDIVARHPTTAVVFEKYHIDFCCGGNVSLESACNSNNNKDDAASDKVVQPSVLLKELVEAAAQQTSSDDNNNDSKERNWAIEEDVHAIIDHIIDDYHVPLKRDLDKLEPLMAKVARVHGSNNHHSELKEMESIFNELAQELRLHLQKEETLLFPYMRSIYEKWIDDSAPSPSHPCGSVTNPIRQMELEHDHAGHALKSLRNLSNSYNVPSDACGSYRMLYESLNQLEHDLHRHVHLENYVLHPLICRMEKDIQQ